MMTKSMEKTIAVSENMTLAEWNQIDLEIGNSMLIGRSVTFSGEDALILGIQTSYDETSSYKDWEAGEEEPEEDSYDRSTKLLVLYEADPEEIDFEDEEYGEPTIREEMLREIREGGQESKDIADIEAFIISERRYERYGMSNQAFADCLSFKMQRLLNEALRAGIVPDRWMKTEARRLWIAEFDVDDEIYEVNWNDGDLIIDAEYEKSDVLRYAGKKFSCARGPLEEPLCITINDPDLGAFEVKVYALRQIRFDEISDRDFLVLEYEAPETLQMNFYRTEYLDGDDTEGGAAAIGITCDDQWGASHEYELIGPADEILPGPVEIELFSYYVQDEELHPAGGETV